MESRQHCIEIYKAAVSAVHPRILVPACLQTRDGLLIAGKKEYDLDAANIFVIGAGKASAAMGQAVEELLGSRIKQGIVVTKYRHGLALNHIQCMEAGHPLPDHNGLLAVERTLATLRLAGPNDIILCLISGGASALWADLPAGITLGEARQTTHLLLGSGADIREMNTVRKHLSLIKGGQLLRCAPGANWISLVISDVPGDDLEVIASGPTVADTSTFSEACSIIEKYGLETRLPASVVTNLITGRDGQLPETVRPGDPVLEHVTNLIIGKNEDALIGAKIEAERLGYATRVINSNLQGDVAVAAKEIFAQILAYNGRTPACLLTGGETTVTLTGNGKGGRNQQLALYFLDEMVRSDPGRKLTFLAAGTDGTDGPTDAAGAFADKSVIRQASLLGMDPLKYLTANDPYHFFQNAGALLKTGSTQTNVMDISIALLG